MSNTTNVRLKDEYGQYRTYNNVGTLMVPTDVEGEQALFYFDIAGGSPSELYQNIIAVEDSIQQSGITSPVRKVTWKTSDNKVCYLISFYNIPMAGTYLVVDQGAQRVSTSTMPYMFDCLNTIIAYGTTDTPYACVVVNKLTGSWQLLDTFSYSIGELLFTADNSKVMPQYDYTEGSDEMEYEYIDCATATVHILTASRSSSYYYGGGNGCGAGPNHIIQYDTYEESVPVVFDLANGTMINACSETDIIYDEVQWKAFDNMFVTWRTTTTAADKMMHIFDCETNTFLKTSQSIYFVSNYVPSMKFTYLNYTYYVMGSMSTGSGYDALCLYNRTTHTLYQLSSKGYYAAYCTSSYDYVKALDVDTRRGFVYFVSWYSSTSSGNYPFFCAVDLSTGTLVAQFINTSYVNTHGNVRVLSTGDVIVTNGGTSTSYGFYLYRHDTHAIAQYLSSNLVYSYYEKNGMLIVAKDDATQSSTELGIIVNLNNYTSTPLQKTTNLRARYTNTFIDCNDGYVVVCGRCNSYSSYDATYMVIVNLSTGAQTVKRAYDIWGANIAGPVAYNCVKVGQKIFFCPYTLSSATTANRKVAVYENGAITLSSYSANITMSSNTSVNMWAIQITPTKKLIHFPNSFSLYDSDRNTITDLTTPSGLTAQDMYVSYNRQYNPNLADQEVVGNAAHHSNGVYEFLPWSANTKVFCYNSTENTVYQLCTLPSSQGRRSVIGYANGYAITQSSLVKKPTSTNGELNVRSVASSALNMDLSNSKMCSEASGNFLYIWQEMYRPIAEWKITASTGQWTRSR